MSLKPIFESEECLCSSNVRWQTVPRSMQDWQCRMHGCRGKVCRIRGTTRCQRATVAIAKRMALFWL